MSARSKIVRDFSGQEVAIPYDPRDDAQHTPAPITLDYEPTGFGRGKLLLDGEHGPELIGTMYGQGRYNYGQELVIRHNAYSAMLEALKGVIGYLGEGSEHPDPCSTNPTWLSGADVEGPCDCYVGRVVAAIHAAEGRADLGVEPVERPVCTCPFASEGYLSKNCALHAAEGK